MPASDTNRPDYQSLGTSKTDDESGKRADNKSLSSPRKRGTEKADDPLDDSSLKSSSSKKTDLPIQATGENGELLGAEVSALNPATKEKSESENATTAKGITEISTSAVFQTTNSADGKKDKKRKEQNTKDRELLDSDNWLLRHGHNLTYLGLYFFSFLVLYRPYEIIPGLGFLSATAYYVGAVTLLIYVPTQFLTEGNVTMLSTEVKCVLAMTVIAFLSIGLAKDHGVAWEVFNDIYIKAVLIFIVMVNVIRTRKRLVALICLSLAIGIHLSYVAISMYLRGEVNDDDQRLIVGIGGLFANPNDLALHLVTMTPIVVCLGIAAKNHILRALCFSIAIMLGFAIIVTSSRGGFLGLIAVFAVLSWKLGRRHRLNVTVASLFVGILVILIAPGNYGLRILSIFIPSLDPTGSRGQRSDLLEQSILVTLRNPWGIGIGNFPIVGIRNLQTHNAFTQVSSELGILGLLAYLGFIISPFRKLRAIERIKFEKAETGWFYYMAIGFQASIIGYMVSSFFLAVAYSWFIYYLIAYAVAFRRIYASENKIDGDIKAETILEKINNLRASLQNA